MERHSKASAGTAASGPEGGVGIVEVIEAVVSTAEEELGDEVGGGSRADGTVADGACGRRSMWSEFARPGSCAHGERGF